MDTLPLDFASLAAAVEGPVPARAEPRVHAAASFAFERAARPRCPRYQRTCASVDESRSAAGAPSDAMTGSSALARAPPRAACRRAASMRAAASSAIMRIARSVMPG